MKTISVETLRVWLEEGRPVTILDVRPTGWTGRDRVCGWENQPDRGLAAAGTRVASAVSGRRHEGLESGLEHC